MKKYIVAGAGIWGCTVARRLAELGHEVVVWERRPFVGGNARSEIDSETGIEVHVYGSHIFHTHNRVVWDFVRRFTDFNGYQHKVLADWRGKLYPLPVGLPLINKFFGVELKPCEVKEFMSDKGHFDAVFDAFFRGYTCKQWGCPAERVDVSVIQRLPVRENYDTNYFEDYWQGIPSEGYNRMFERMLDHPNISVECNHAFCLSELVHGGLGSAEVFYSGPIDALFDYSYGCLPWRSLRFETEKIGLADFQGTSVVNYPELEVPYTRIHEFKHYHPNRRYGSLWEKDSASDKTIVMREFPVEWHRGMDEPYYPISGSTSSRLLHCYLGEVESLNRKLARRGSCLVVGGRLGSYRYLDMDQAMSEALSLEIAGRRKECHLVRGGGSS